MAQLRRIWLDITNPAFYCKGLCADSCGPIGMTLLEESLLPRPAGFRADLSCDFLIDGRCSVYDDRPTVCRLYGAIPEMRCGHGCTPPMAEGDGDSILRRVWALSQGMGVGERPTTTTTERLPSASLRRQHRNAEDQEVEAAHEEEVRQEAEGTQQ